MITIPRLQLKDKTVLFPLFLSLALVNIVFAISYIGNNSVALEKGAGEPIARPTPQTVVVKKVLPDEPHGLTSGIPHTFYIFFSGQVPLSELDINLAAIDLTQDNATGEMVTIQKDTSLPDTVELRTADPIKENHLYSLTVTNTKTGEVLAAATYPSRDVETAATKNNPDLKAKLPHETATYLLEYLSETNTYVFHFKFNPGLSGTAEEQYNNAREQAIQFITEQGIDISTIVIEWRHS